jgi:GxxExxY protein
MIEGERDARTYEIIGAAIEVQRRLGHGFLEAVHQEALAIEFAHRGIPFEREVDLRISYRNHILRTHYIADFVCHGSVIVELKAASAMDSAHVAQVINCLKATGSAVGLLLNFGTPRLEWKRLVFSGAAAEIPPENLES